MKKLLIAALLVAGPSVAATLKQGTFVCENHKYESIPLVVKQHPTKSNKAILNWEGRDRIVHREPTVTGAVRYEGAVSKIAYVQAPHHSVLLDNNTMKVILSGCIIK